MRKFRTSYALTHNQAIWLVTSDSHNLSTPAQHIRCSKILLDEGALLQARYSSLNRRSGHVLSTQENFENLVLSTLLHTDCSTRVFQTIKSKNQ